MPFDRMRIFRARAEKKEELPRPSAEERALTEHSWYHGSPKIGLQRLRPGGRRFFTLEDGVHISLTKTMPRLYGKNVSEWKLKGPLKIVALEELGPEFSRQKKALRKVGYVGYYWTDKEGVGSGVVWDGRDLEKVGEIQE
ncbi:hypothetical protein HY968_03920 [Candidatus Kaiserbacteria bacterium]|nr:hypothetical protein [Candidatus Kaiserbacteria bacterium]